MNQTVDQISPETLSMIESQARLAGLSADAYLKSLIPNGNGTEKNVHDARIAAQMSVNDIDIILTFNAKDSSRYTNITAVEPAGV